MDYADFVRVIIWWINWKWSLVFQSYLIKAYRSCCCVHKGHLKWPLNLIHYGTRPLSLLLRPSDAYILSPTRTTVSRIRDSALHDKIEPHASVTAPSVFSVNVADAVNIFKCSYITRRTAGRWPGWRCRRRPQITEHIRTDFRWTRSRRDPETTNSIRHETSYFHR